MPKVFISYARPDQDPVERLHEALAANGISVWRDQASLYGGQAWPKALGEAVAASDFVLLCWSRYAQAAPFVELEWTTALALKKPIIPLLLDGTALPPSLAAINGIFLKGLDETVEALMKALAVPVPEPPAGQQAGVLRALEAAPDAAPRQVVDAMRAAFAQQGWLVQGHVIQVFGGNVHLGAGEQQPKKTLLDRWRAWVALGVAVLALLGLSLDVPEKVLKFFEPETGAKTYPLAGIVLDEAGEPLAGVIVRLGDVDEVVPDTTDAGGRFRFEVRAAEPRQVSLTAMKDGYVTYRSDPMLDNANFEFKMQKRHE